MLMSEWVIISLGMLLLGGLIVSGFCFPRFYREVVFEKWGAGIASFMGKLVIAGISLWGANYYYHNVFIFNQDRANSLNIISKNLTELRMDINQLSALIKMRENNELKSMSEKKLQFTVKKTVSKITNSEINLANLINVSYYFGENTSEKIRRYIVWSNYITSTILKKEYYPPDKITDTYYYSMIFSIHNQLYNPIKCKECKLIGNMTQNEIIEKYSNGNKYSLDYLKLHINKLNYQDIIYVQQLANNFK